MKKEERIKRCIRNTGIEDGKTCLDTQGAIDLSNDVWYEAQKYLIEKIIIEAKGDKEIPAVMLEKLRILIEKDE